MSQDTQASLPEQHDMNAETADDLQATVIGSFEDDAVSRSIGDRPGLSSMLRFLDDHPEVNCVIIPQWDRLVGGLDQHTSIVNRLRFGGLALHTYDREVDYTDDDQLTELERSTTSSVEEVRRVRKRVRRALRSKVRSGLYASRPPFGLTMKPVLTPDGKPVPEGQVLLDDRGRVIRSGQLDLDRTIYGQGADARPAYEWLQYIFEATAAGAPYAEVAHHLRRHGVRTKGGGVGWNAQGIARIIKRETYLGFYTWGASKVVHEPYGDGRWVEAREPGSRDTIRNETSLGEVISRDLWERANAEVTQRRNHKVRGRTPSEMFERVHAERTASELVVCARCGMRMYARMEYPRNVKNLDNYVPKWRYECHGKRRGIVGKAHAAVGFPQCTDSHSMGEGPILAALRDDVAAAGKFAPSFVTARVVEHDNSAAIAACRERIAAARTKIERVRDMFVEGDIDRDDMRRRVAVHDKTIESAQKELAAYEASSTQALAVPTPARRAVVKVLRDILADATREWPDVEETQRHREAVTGLLRKYVTKIEINSPEIVVHLRAVPRSDGA